MPLATKSLLALFSLILASAHALGEVFLGELKSPLRLQGRIEVPHDPITGYELRYSILGSNVTGSALESEFSFGGLRITPEDEGKTLSFEEDDDPGFWRIDEVMEEDFRGVTLMVFALPDGLNSLTWSRDKRDETYFVYTHGNASSQYNYSDEIVDLNEIDITRIELEIQQAKIESNGGSTDLLLQINVRLYGIENMSTTQRFPSDQVKIYSIPTADYAHPVSLQFDSCGNPAIGFWAEHPDSIGIAEFDGLNWNTETIEDSESILPDSVSFVYDRTDNPIFCFAGSRFRFARRNQGTWLFEELPESIIGVRNATILLNPDGHPAIAFYDAERDVPSMVVSDGSSWSVAHVIEDSTKIWGGMHGVSFAYSLEGRPTISFIAEPGSYLGLATFDGAQWLTENAAPTTGDNRLAYNSDGIPTIAYGDSGGFPNVLRFIESDGDIGIFSVIDAESYTRQLSLAYDSQDQPSVAYYDYRFGKLNFARRENGAWQRYTLLDSVSPYLYKKGIDLKYDPDGRPHIVFYDGGELKLAIIDESVSPDSSLSPFSYDIYSQGLESETAIIRLNNPNTNHQYKLYRSENPTETLEGWIHFDTIEIDEAEEVDGTFLHTFPHSSANPIFYRVAPCKPAVN